MWVHSINKDRETHGEYVIFIGMWHHIYWNVASYLLECGIIFIGMWHHIYWNVASYLIYWNAASYLLECGIIFIEMWHHIY